MSTNDQTYYRYRSNQNSKSREDQKNTKNGYSENSHFFQTPPPNQHLTFNLSNNFFSSFLSSRIFRGFQYDAINPAAQNPRNTSPPYLREEPYRLQFIKISPSTHHRFVQIGGHAQLNNIFNFQEKIAYSANVALLFDPQLRHSSKYELSLPIIGSAGGQFHASSSVMKKKLQLGTQFKRRRKKIQFVPNKWQNMQFSYSFNQFTASHFQTYNSDTQRLYFLTMDYGINKIFKNKTARSMFNSINDLIFLNNKLLSKEYSFQHELKSINSIPKQKFQLAVDETLKYQYAVHTKLFVGYDDAGVKSILRARCSFQKNNMFKISSNLETGILACLDNSIENTSSDDEQDQKEVVSHTRINNLLVQNVPGYYQLYSNNENLNFFFALRNKLYPMKLEKFGIKPFIHSNVYSGSAPSKVVLNGGLGVSYKVKFLGCKLDFLLTSPNLLASKEDYNPYQIIFNV